MVLTVHMLLTHHFRRGKDDERPGVQAYAVLEIPAASEVEAGDVLNKVIGILYDTSPYIMQERGEQPAYAYARRAFGAGPQLRTRTSVQIVFAHVRTSNNS